VDRERSSLVYWLARADALERRKSWVIASAGLIVSFWAGVALVLARLEAGRRKKATEENIQLQSDLQERESKIRHLFDANIIGIVIFDFEGRFIDANDAFLNMVGYNREDLVSGRMNRTDMTPVEWRAISEQRMAYLRAAAPSEAFEKEYFRKDGSRVPFRRAAIRLRGVLSPYIGLSARNRSSVPSFETVMSVERFLTTSWRCSCKRVLCHTTC
jgi:PAS domain S-box-containing protein